MQPDAMPRLEAVLTADGAAEEEAETILSSGDEVGGDDGEAIGIVEDTVRGSAGQDDATQDTAPQLPRTQKAGTLDQWLRQGSFWDTPATFLEQPAEGATFAENLKASEAALSKLQ